jgi:hypothetical protein
LDHRVSYVAVGFRHRSSDQNSNRKDKGHSSRSRSHHFPSHYWPKRKVHQQSVSLSILRIVGLQPFFSMSARLFPLSPTLAFAPPTSYRRFDCPPLKWPLSLAAEGDPTCKRTTKSQPSRVARQMKPDGAWIAEQPPEEIGRRVLRCCDYGLR